MCSVGGEADINVIGAEELETNGYLCLDCGNKFRGLGKNILCPTCKSPNVELV
jgi:Zn finger protein HypA/HybF involved in hydrogenase expression